MGVVVRSKCSDEKSFGRGHTDNDQKFKTIIKGGGVVRSKIITRSRCVIKNDQTKEDFDTSQ